MQGSLDNYRRSSIRLPGFDYSAPGFYFVTVCAAHRINYFGEIVNGEMRLSPIGEITKEELLATQNIRPNVYIYEWIIMPNHIHAIIKIIHEGWAEDDEKYFHMDGFVGIDCKRNDFVGAGEFVGIDCNQYLQSPRYSPFHKFGPQRGNLFSIIRGFKGAVSRRAQNFFNHKNEPIWQARFYDRIVRDRAALDQIRHYIRNNVANWQRDLENHSFKKNLSAIERANEYVYLKFD
ncbi:MAG: transposase [Parcubacteria group bacterium]